MSGLGYLPTTILNVAEVFTNLTKCTLVNTLYIIVTLALNNLLIVGLLSSPIVKTSPSKWPSRATYTCKKKQFSKGRVFSYFVGMDKLFYFFQVPLDSLHDHSKNKGNYMF